MKESIKKIASELGYVACGIASVEDFTEYYRAVEARMAQFPEAAHLYNEMVRRSSPQSTAPWAKSIVVCVRSYGHFRIPPEVDGRIGRNYLFDRRCKRSPEHSISREMKTRLKAFGLKVRKGGVPDRWAGARAGVTRFGKNCFAYAEGYGSWINIETWFIDAKIDPDEPTIPPKCPEGCRACIDACPTGALSAPFIMRMNHCIAYLTYSAPEPVAPELWSKMGTWIYGCDRCQVACPQNKDRWHGTHRASWLEEKLEYLTPEAIAAMDLKTYQDMVHPLFWYIPPDEKGLERWKRNSRRAIGNRNLS
jgi:epoxyqueuosine reductase